MSKNLPNDNSKVSNGDVRQALFKSNDEISSNQANQNQANYNLTEEAELKMPIQHTNKEPETKQSTFNCMEFLETVYSKMKNNKKAILISFGVIAALSAVALILIFFVFSHGSSASNLQPQVFYRSFKENQKHNYIKKLTSCSLTKNTNKDQEECNFIEANMAFYISNVTDSKDFFKDTEQIDNFKEPEQKSKFDFKMITTLLYFSNLTFANSTDSFTFYGPNFDEIVQKGQIINSTDYEHNGPVFKAVLFDNGTIYQIYKPKLIKNISWEYIVESIKEFSPDLETFLYDEKIILQTIKI